MSVIQLVILSAVLAVCAYFVNRTISSQQTERYLDAIKNQRSTLIELAAKKTPRELDHIFLKLSPAPMFFMPRAKKLIRDNLWLYVTESLNHQLISEWSNSHQEMSDGLFAVHSYANADGLIDSMGKSYYLLPRDFQKKLNELNPRSHLNENLTDFFSSFFSDDEPLKIEKKGSVDKPISADIYGPIILASNNASTSSNQSAKQNSMKQLWDAYKEWLETVAPEAIASLNKPTSQSQIDQTIAALIVGAHSDWIAFYRLHNGQQWESIWCFPEGQWLSLDDVVVAYKQLKADMGSEWHDQWIPILYDGGASYSFIDEKGRLMNFYFEEGLVEEIAPSLNAWLNQLNQQAESGLIKFDEVNGVLFLDE